MSNGEMKRAIKACADLYESFGKMGLGDPFASGRMREAILADYLNHNLGNDLHGCDAYDDDGNVFEYKTTLVDHGLAGRYDVSWYPTWEEQVEYLEEEKIANNQYHFYATFTRDMKLVDVWRLDGNKVLELLLPKLERKFFSNVQTKNKSLHGTLSAKDIRENGVHVRASFVRNIKEAV